MSNMMKFDMQGVAPARIYKLLGALVIPRPIALVSTVNPEGKVNAAPISFFNVMGTNPPIVVLCPSNREDGTPKDTALNIHSTHEFVVNLVDEAMGEAMVKCAKGLPHGESELDFAGLTAAPSSMVKPPRVVEAPVALECKEVLTQYIGGNRVVIGEVLCVHAREGIVDPASWRVNYDHMHLIARLNAPNGYCTTRDQFKMDPV